jgi:hypothetical protein
VSGTPLILTINWSKERLLNKVAIWNNLDPNIKFKVIIGQIGNFLDVRFENQSGQPITSVFHKPSHETYYLPFNTVHAMHIKRNIPFAAQLRAIRYSSNFQVYINERKNIRIGSVKDKHEET